MSTPRKSIVNTPSIVDMLRGVGTDFRLGMQQNNFRGRKFVFCTIFLSPKGDFPQILGKHCLPCPPTCVRRPWISIRIGVCIKEKVGRHFQFMHYILLYVKVELDYICMLAMQFDNLIIFLVLLNNEKMGGKCYILFPFYKIEILYTTYTYILGHFTSFLLKTGQG